MNRAKSSKQPRTAPSGVTLIPGLLEWGIIAAIMLLAFTMVRFAGARRGLELMPWPDGLEYAASAVNLAKGRGAVLHFGGYTYPSRYTGGYPLLLEFFYRVRGPGFAPFLASMFFGTVSLFLILILTRAYFGRGAAIVAALTLALSPIFITYSSLVMSDVPTLFVTVFAVMMLLGAAFDGAPELPNWRQILDWAIFGLVAGFSTIIRPTNVTILAGAASCMVMVPLERQDAKRDLPSLVNAAIGLAIGFAIPVAWQLHQNSINLGSAFASGYSWWVPEVYGAGGKTFSAAYLFGPTMPRNPHGNVIVYATTLLGVDGMLGDRGNARYFLYPFAAAMFAIVGFVVTFRTGTSAARRLMWFGLGYLGALTALYCFYIFTDVAFILPAAFILFLAAGEGAAIANRWMRDVVRRQDRSASQLAAAAGVIVLDLMLIVSLATEAVVRLSVQPQTSVMVESMLSLDASLPADATIVSNISLQFLDLYLGETRDYVGLNSMDPGERFTDYHLHRLYEKRAAGWSGPVPKVAFDGEQMSAAGVDSIASAIQAKTPVFLLVAAPESQAYAVVLKGELDQLQGKFAVEVVTQNEAVAVYRLSAR